MGLYENKNNSLSLLAGGTCYADSPVGAILPFGGSNPPSGYLLCDGQAVSRSYYAELFTVIGTSFGSGDGSTTFNVPNLKGKATVGLDSSDTSFNAIGKSGGEKTHKLTVTELPSHAHKTGISTSAAFGAGPAGSDTAQVFFAQSISDTSYIGGNGAHNNLQPYVTTNYIIKAKQSAIPLPFEDAIDDKIATLDVASVGGSGKYISAISETDGKISATVSNLSTTPTSGSAAPITSGGVRAALDSFGKTYVSDTKTWNTQGWSTALTATFSTTVPAGRYLVITCIFNGGWQYVLLSYNGMSGQNVSATGDITTVMNTIGTVELNSAISSLQYSVYVNTNGSPTGAAAQFTIKLVRIG